MANFLENFNLELCMGGVKEKLLSHLSEFFESGNRPWVNMRSNFRTPRPPVIRPKSDKKSLNML